MLVELGLVEQRCQAVLEVVRDGATVTDVARRHGVARQTVHVWLRAYAAQGLRGLADRSSRPLSCPHQMDPVVEARVVGLRREHPGWGPRTIRTWLEREGVEPVPGRTSIERCLVRHGLVTPEARKRKRKDYRRWERARAMELWQMDVVGGVRLVDGSEAKIVSGIDDHSRFVVSAMVVARATARPVCDALALAMRRHGVPDQVLTDNGKVFSPVRPRPRAGAVRPDLRGERDPAPADGATVTDNDGQGRTLAQDAAPGVPRRQGVRLARRRAGAARRLGPALQP